MRTSSLVSHVLIRIACWAALLVIAAASAGYWYVYQAAEQRTLEDLERYVRDRGRNESRIFTLAEDNLAIFRDAFLERYLEGSAYGEEAFRELFRSGEDGVTRLRRRFFEGAIWRDGLHHSGMSAFVGRARSAIDSDLRRRLTLSLKLVSRFGPAWINRFANLHVTMPENAIVMYWPEAPWGLDARPDLDMTAGTTVRATLQRYNPERQPVWKGLYFDHTAGEWVIPGAGRP